ncbi:MAG: hypothetical protein JSR44_02860 [Spirochaetes bacterium]|nr:hypothetical protein [Spirochaetota bacterium]
MNWRLVIKLLLFTIVHLALSFGARHLFATSGTVTVFWPAIGWAIAATLAGGYTYAIAAVVSTGLFAIIAPGKGIIELILAVAAGLEILIARSVILRLAKIDIAFANAGEYLKGTSKKWA